MQRLVLLTMCAAFLIGCDLAKPQGSPEAPPSEPGVSAEPAVAAPESPSEKPPTEAVAEEKTEKPAQEADGEAVNSETVNIEQGFTGKGQYGQTGGEQVSDIITVPVGALFSTRERVFMMTLQNAENMYKADNDNKMPATHEEYMEKIVNANMIKLPELPDGQEYLYDPDTQKLMIKKPK